MDSIAPLVGGLRSSALQDDSFDLTFCISTIEHIGRDNSIYFKESSSREDDGDFKAMKELYRIARRGGRVVLTVPFDKAHDYGWFIQYDNDRWMRLLGQSRFEIIRQDFYIYREGWHSCRAGELSEVLYKDNGAPAAAGLVCALLQK